MLMNPYTYYTAPPHIVISRKEFDSARALFLAILCYQAKLLIKFPQVFTTPEFPEEYQLVTVLQGSTNGSSMGHGYILESRDSIYMVFRGSASYADLYSDANAFLVPLSLVNGGGLVHNGFYSIYTKNVRDTNRSLRDEILRALSQLNPSKRLFISGFSLGGAIATLCALDIAVNTQFKHPIIYTFASPRVGDSTFAKAFNHAVHQSFRVVNFHDYIPIVPPQFLGYHHVKTKIELLFNAGSIQNNHNLRKAYIPALYTMNPGFGKELCRKNPHSFCPDTIPHARL